MDVIIFIFVIFRQLLPITYWSVMNDILKGKHYTIFKNVKFPKKIKTPWAMGYLQLVAIRPIATNFKYHIGYSP